MPACCPLIIQLKMLPMPQTSRRVLCGGSLNIFQEAAVQQFLYIGSFWGQVQLHFSPKHPLIFHISFFFILFFLHFQCSLFNKVYNTERAAWKPLNGWHNSQSTCSSIIFIFLDKCTRKFLLHKGISCLFIN